MAIEVWKRLRCCQDKAMAKKREDTLMEKCRCGNIEEQGSSAKPREALKWFSSSANAVKTSHMWQILYFEQSYELIFFAISQ